MYFPPFIGANPVPPFTMSGSGHFPKNPLGPSEGWAIHSHHHLSRPSILISKWRVAVGNQKKSSRLHLTRSTALMLTLHPVTARIILPPVTCWDCGHAAVFPVSWPVPNASPLLREKKFDEFSRLHQKNPRINSKAVLGFLSTLIYPMRISSKNKLYPLIRSPFRPKGHPSRSLQKSFFSAEVQGMILWEAMYRNKYWISNIWANKSL